MFSYHALLGVQKIFFIHQTMLGIFLFCNSLTGRHPYPSGRPVFHDIRLVLLQHDETLLGVPAEALTSHPQAGQLGAPLEAGHYMYPSLQHIYLKNR